MGAVGGFIGFTVFSLFVATELLFPNTRAQFRQVALDAIQRAASRSPDPQAQQVIEFFKTSQGMTLMFVVGAVFLLVLYVALSSLGGLITAAFFRRREVRPVMPFQDSDAPEQQNEEAESSRRELPK